MATERDPGSVAEGRPGRDGRGDPIWRMVDLLRPVDRWPAEELFQTLVERGGVRVERIVSTGQVSPEGGCYDQAWDEWVVLLSGEAVIEFMDGAGRVVLRPGQAVFIPAHCRHRVAWTPPDVQSIWLAVHFPASASAE